MFTIDKGIELNTHHLHGVEVVLTTLYGQGQLSTGLMEANSLGSCSQVLYYKSLM